MDMQGLGGGEGGVVGEPGVEGAAERAAAFVDRIDSQQRLAQLFGLPAGTEAGEQDRQAQVVVGEGACCGLRERPTRSVLRAL